ncbi:MAG: helix-turn-helix transcriptional regulator, partial [Endomicrobium sp.]|nr:helix-turn-helix transcriptional regulator [Endomicrobium sp.]
IKNYTAQKIKEAVKETGLTQGKFAKKIGIGESMISQWLASSRNPSLTILKKIARATNKPLSYFLDDSQTNVTTGDNFVLGKSHNVTSGINSNGTLEFELLKKEVENLTLKMDFVLEKLKKIDNGW